MDNFDRIILADKPPGISSFGVVARVRRQLSQQAGKKIKVGHTGTLDPFATGLMILVSGKWTRRAGEFSKLDKVYEAEIRLGATSTTGDPEGAITDNEVKTVPEMLEIQAALQKFIGEITQKPPIFSAIKIDGERAYKLARAGKPVEIPPRQVTVYKLELLEYTFPILKIRTHVSSGTYIRTLAEDIGKVLDTGAYVLQLRRTKVGDYNVADAERIEK